MGVTKELAGFIVSARLSEVSIKAREAAKTAILDCIGVTLAGSVEPCARIARRLVQTAGSQEATILGTQERTSAPEAALVNGIAGHALDYDDWYGRPAYYLGHPSVCLVPAILAIAEKTGSSGAKIIEAYLVGFEIGAKLGVAMSNEHYQRGWHATGNLGTLRATAAVAKLLDLDVTQTRYALGIAASQASGLRGNFGTMTKPFHAGHASRCGVEAALLSQYGFSASGSILEDQYGFCAAFSGRDRFDLSTLIESLGQPWEIDTPGINLKKYPSCGGTHTGIDAMLDLVQENNFSVDEVDSIRCEMSEDVRNVLVYTRPETGLEGKFSIEYCLAAALVDRDVTLRQFTDLMVNRPEIQALLKKVELAFLPASNRGAKDLTTKITIVLKNGRILSKCVEKPRGDASRPLSQLEIRAKYRQCAGLVLAQAQIDRSIDLIENLEEVDSVEVVTRLLRPHLNQAKVTPS